MNAAVCAQALVDKFQAEVLINTGVAGSLDAAIDIGDIVISTAAVQHDMDATVFGDPLGQVPQMDTFLFPADECLVQKAKEVNEKVNPDIHTFTGIVQVVISLSLPKRRKRRLSRISMRFVRRWKGLQLLMRHI